MLKTQVIRLASHLSSRRLGVFERQAKLAQGKGWGTATTAEEVAGVRELLGQSADGPLVVLDVGANVGTWTTESLNAFPLATIHAFEPSSAAFAKLSLAVGGNPRVSVHQLALSDADGDAVLYENVPGSGLGSLTKRRLDHFGIELSHEERVPTRTLESWSRSNGVSTVDVLKLDVEGHELAVLKGARRMLSDIRIVQFEFGGCNIDTRTYFQDFWYLLTEAGFQIHRLAPSGPRLIPEYSEHDEVFVTTNYLASR